MRTEGGLHTTHTLDGDQDLRQKLAAQTARADVAEALLSRERELNESLALDRDHWRRQAELLLSAHHKKKAWWPWTR